MHSHCSVRIEADRIRPIPLKGWIAPSTFGQHGPINGKAGIALGVFGAHGALGKSPADASCPQGRGACSRSSGLHWLQRATMMARQIECPARLPQSPGVLGAYSLMGRIQAHPWCVTICVAKSVYGQECQHDPANRRIAVETRREAAGIAVCGRARFFRARSGQACRSAMISPDLAS